MGVIEFVRSVSEGEGRFKAKWRSTAANWEPHSIPLPTEIVTRYKHGTMKTSLLSLVLLLSLTAVLAAAPSADDLITEAKAKATAEKKAIYVHFGASWCGWCKRLDAFLERPDIKPVFEKYFVPVKLVVQENEKNKALENAGADAWLKKVGGPEGLPFSAFLDSKGTMIVNSKRPSNAGSAGGNIGHPTAPEEIDWFVTMMKKAAPKISEADLKVIETALRSQKK